MWIVIATVAASAFGGARLARALRRDARRYRELLAQAAARAGETVDLDGLTFNLEPTVRALCDLARLDSAAALLARPPGIEVWSIVHLACNQVDANAPLTGVTSRTVAVPGLVSFHCPTCDRRYPGPALVLRREARLQDLGGLTGGHVVYDGLCPAQHVLPSLPPYEVLVN